uniref:Uncharacterized protein n=1 Tax=Timema cristinae TaxID=61476 RepID=A0A7R9GZM2_TIMCR|nr:unnamed protein product [Timema cristinae]
MRQCGMAQHKATSSHTSRPCLMAAREVKWDIFSGQMGHSQERQTLRFTQTQSGAFKVPFVWRGVTKKCTRFGGRMAIKRRSCNRQEYRRRGDWGSTTSRAYSLKIKRRKPGRTCKRLEYLCRDRTLWERVDSRPTRLTMAQTKETLTLVRPKAAFLAIRGQAHIHDEKLPCQFFVELSSKCFTLETLILEDCYFSAQEVALKDFPSSVKYLSLRGCVLTQLNPARSFFSGIQDHMPNIETIVLSNCDWFPAHSIMPLSKCSRLKELRLDGIASVVNNVAYFSLATKFGFQALELVTDLRLNCGPAHMKAREQAHVTCPLVPHTAGSMFKSAGFGPAEHRRGRSRDKLFPSHCVSDTLVP